MRWLTCERRNEAGAYLIVALLSVLLVICFHRLWQADLRVPFAYGVSDELTVLMGAKWLIENPWIFYNPKLGMPFGSVMYDIPEPDVFHYACIKLLAFFTHDPALLVNLFYLLTFPATALITFFVMRALRFTRISSVAVALLYAFLPYHFQRGEAHLFLAGYYSIPLMCLLLFRLASDAPPFFDKSASAHFTFQLRSRDTIFPAIVCIIMGASGVYYAFFACLLLATLGPALAIAARSLRPLVSSAVMVAVIASVVGLCLLPHFLKGHQNPATRVTADAETYAVKLTQLLLPISGHRIPALAALKDRYYHSAPLVNENDSAAIGFVGAAGLLFLLGRAACRVVQTDSRSSTRDDNLLNVASIAPIVSLLYSTIGGFGSLFSLLVSPQIRSLNRISVFIAFFCLVGVAVVLDRLLQLSSNRNARRSGGALVAAITALGLYDQTSPIFAPNYAALAAAYHSDQRFIREVEQSLPKGAMVFQLPYMTYPDASEYDHARGYLHSKALRWSYGAMVNERSDLWQRDVQMQPVSAIVRRMLAQNFAGIYVDRRLYGDKSADFEQQLTDELGAPTVVSESSKLAFFDLSRYRRPVP